MTYNMSKLPKSAQSEIVNLRAEVSSLKDDLQVAACQKETKTYVASYEFDRKAQTFLPDNSRVRFELRPHAYIDVRREELEGREEQITIYGSDSICIHPVVSNVVYVSLGRIP